MQRKNSGSYFTRQQSTLFHSSKNNSSNRKRLSVTTQTDNVPNFTEKLRICNLSLMSMEEIKENYIRTLNFLNQCNDFINKIFGESGDVKFGEEFGFRVPKVPNYFNVLEMFLEKRKIPMHEENCSKNDSLLVAKGKKDRREVRDKEIEDEQIIFDLQQFLPKNIGDGPGSVNSQRGVIRNSRVENNTNQAIFKNQENFKTDNGLKNFGVKKRPSRSPSRLVKSEKDISKRSSHHELKALSTTFEEILKTCNDFERKSKENLLNKLEFNQNHIEHRDNMIMENFNQGDQEKNQREDLPPEQDSPNRENASEAINKNARDNFNLLEYALRNLRDSEHGSNSSLSPRSRAPTINSENANAISCKGLPTTNVSNILLNLNLTNKKSWTLLNEAYQSPSPKRVNEMFNKISKENLRISSDEKSSESNCDFNDTQTFIKFVDNDNFSDELGREYASKIFIENCDHRDKANDNVRITSSSDSIILTDEEFERKNRNSFVIWSNQTKSCNENQLLSQRKTTEDNRLTQEIKQKPRKSHPLKLTEKDRSQADQKILQGIGLFTEKGDIRPGVISILEEKERMSFMQDSTKNVQFRAERKFDIEVHYNMNNKEKGIEKQASNESLCSKGSPDQQIESNTSLHSSAVSFSSSTVSDSDLISMEPNSDQTVIKKL